MKISQPFIERPIATSLLMISFLLAGIFAYQLLPVSALPEVDYPTMQVSTFYPGASPDVMASSVTAPLERQFGQMPGLGQMTSTSSNGASVITLQFELKINLDVAEQEVQAAINAASTYLPSDLPAPPIYNKVNPADTPILTLAATSKVLPLTQVEDLVETRLSQKISQLPGVGLVSITGGQRPAIRIQANTNALSSYGLNLEDLRNTITNANVNAAKGTLDGPKLSYTLNSNDQLVTKEDYSSLIVAYKNGAPIYLSNVAQVQNGSENVKLAAWENNHPAIIINIQRQPGANVIDVVDRIKSELPQLSATLPSTMKLSILSDRTVSIRSSVHDAEFELLLSVTFVVLVIFIFLRNLPATIIPSVAVPLSLIGTLAIMYKLGFSVNNLTLMALIIAAGFVVDDAIVMIENIARYIEQGETPLEAALKGSAQIGFTILSLTFSLIAVLIPLLFMGDVIGRLFREFAMTLSTTILISAFVSLTLTPMMCALFLRHHTKKEKSLFEQKSEQILDSIIKKYGSTLKVILDHQKIVLIIAIATLLVTLAMFYFIPKGFFPLQDTGLLQGISEAPQSISFPEMVNRQKTLSKVILQDPAVESLSSFIGIDGTNTTLNSGRFLIILKPQEERHLSAHDVQTRLQKKLKDVLGITLYLQPVQDLSVDSTISRTQYQYSVSGPNAQDVADWNNALLKQFQKTPQIHDVASDEQNFGFVTYLDLDRDTMGRLGITTQMLDDTLYDAFGQRQISTLFTQVNQYHVVLEMAPNFSLSPNALDHIYITTPASSGPIPISTFVHVVQKNAPLSIKRKNQFPVANISFNLSQGTSLGTAISAIDAFREKMDIPLRVQTSFEGTAKNFKNSLANEGILLLAAIVVVYIVLGILYESYIHPITILSTLPSAGFGALMALILFGSDLNIIALIGIILLIGIVMKNAIMMIDFALDLERKEGKEPREAIYEACLLRFRPILMTSMAAMLGAVPLAFSSGMGAELRSPLGIAIIGGLVVSQLLTLYTTPVIYLAFDKLTKKVMK